MLSLVLAAALAVALVPARAFAQDASTPGSRIELTGYIGALAPLARLADQGDSLRAELSTKVTFGGEFNYWFPSGLGVGVMGLYSNPDLTVQRTNPDDTGFPETIKIGASDYWALMGTLGWRPRLTGSAAVLLPYIALGGGVRHLSTPTDQGFVVDTGDRAIGVLAGGGQLMLSPRWHLRLDIRDFVYKFDAEPFSESKLQNDLQVMVGIGARLN
jgi:hypothetical protein